jgi:hypothetical protein
MQPNKIVAARTLDILLAVDHAASRGRQTRIDEDDIIALNDAVQRAWCSCTGRGGTRSRARGGRNSGGRASGS